MSESDAMTCDVLVVGGGIAGASVAWRLATYGQVMLLEREAQAGYHATGRSAAMFMETYGTPRIRALTAASRAFFERPPAGFVDHPILSARGAMHVAGIGQERALSDALAAAQALSDRVVSLTVADVVARCPVMRADRLCGAIHEPDAMDIDVHALHQGYLRGFRAAGGRLLCEADVVQATRAGGQWRVVLQDGRHLACATIVNAAGAWADVLAGRCGVRPIGLQPRRRTAFTFEPPAGCEFAAWPCVIGIDERYYFKPDAGQLLGSPANADPVEPHDVLPEELDVATGIHFIEEATTMRIRRPRHAWAGLRSFVPDGDPVVGWDDHVPGFFWLAGQGGYGIQTAAAVSELAASRLRGEALPSGLVRFGLDRSDLLPSRL